MASAAARALKIESMIALCAKVTLYHVRPRA
jgi:hypothetical protein